MATLCMYACLFEALVLVSIETSGNVGSLRGSGRPEQPSSDGVAAGGCPRTHTWEYRPPIAGVYQVVCVIPGCADLQNDAQVFMLDSCDIYIYIYFPWFSLFFVLYFLCRIVLSCQLASCEGLCRLPYCVT